MCRRAFFRTCSNRCASFLRLAPLTRIGVFQQNFSTRLCRRGARKLKFDALAGLSLVASGWTEGAKAWREPFLPEQTGAWATFPSLAEFFVWSSPGVKTHRTWVISPDAQSLEARWEILKSEKDANEKENLFHPDRDRYLGKEVKVDLGPYHVRGVTIALDEGPVVPQFAIVFVPSIANGLCLIIVY